MWQLHRIDSLDDPALAPYLTLRRSREHERAGIFVAEGDKVVERLLVSRLPVVSLLIVAERWPEFEPQVTPRPEEIHVYLGPKTVLEQITGFPLFQGVLAVARIPTPPTLTGLIAQAPAPRLFVALDGLSNAENLGVLVRNAAAFGSQGLITDPTCSSPWLRRAVRNSMGAIFQLPAVEVAVLAAALFELRAQGIRCVAAHPHTDQRKFSQIRLTGDCCLVFGSEGHGISPPVLAACDEAVAIPMSAEVDSLNVASASAAFLYEVQRQRGLA